MNFEADDIIVLQTKYNETTARTERADALANRATILTTARRLFAEQGVSAVCMSAIAEAAGVGKGTLYRRFANKGALCLALMDEDMRQFQDEILQYLRENASIEALVQLDYFLDRLIHFMDSHIPLMSEAQQGRAMQGTETGRQSIHGWFHGTVVILLQRGQQTGEVGPIDIPYWADAILAPLNPNLLRYQREILGFELERISLGLREMVMGGLKHSGF